MHRLHFGDNLPFMRDMPDESVDLIYLDPPFNSKKVYNVIVNNAQAKAYDDTWSWSADDMRIYKTLVRRGNKISNWTEGMLKIIGSCGMLSYLYFMAERLIECQRLLKDTGSIYLHCDKFAVHHLRTLMDAVFGPAYFRNEIVWSYKYGGRSKKNFGQKHDTLLRYSCSKIWTFNLDAIKIPHEEASLKQNFRYTDEHGRRYRKGTWPSGKEYRYYADEGRTPDDVWVDIGSLHQADKERTGYATQKPEALLERIIKASSNPGDMVFDPFVGSGTASVVAAKLGRDSIACDLTYMAIDKAERRLQDAGFEVEVSGEPQTFKQAEALAVRDKFQFQAWMLNVLGVSKDKQKTAKKGADSGIDGVWVDILKDDTVYKTIISVKGGKNKLVHVRELIGTVTKEGAQRGVLACLYKPTKAMIKTAAMAGIGEQDEEKCVIICVPELLEGKRIPVLRDVQEDVRSQE